MLPSPQHLGKLLGEHTSYNERSLAIKTNQPAEVLGVSK